MSSKPSQSPTSRFDGSAVRGQTQSIESHVGPQTLLGSRVTSELVEPCAAFSFVGTEGKKDRPFVNT